MKKIHVVGGGFSGLSLAYLLSKTKLFDISVYEKKSHLGGLIQSAQTDIGVVESAANSILCNDQTLNFLNEISADYIRPLPTAKKRYFFRGRLTRWPLNIFETLVLIPKIIFHLLTKKKYLTPQKNQSVQAWSEKFLGKAFTQYILSPALQGIYATTADQLNAEVVLGSMLSQKKSKYQGIVTGRQGMQDIITALEKKCRENRVQFFLNTEYRFNESANGVVICTSAAEACQTVMLHYPEVAHQLNKIQMNSVLSMTCSTTTSRPRGFGALIAKNQNIKCLGVLFNADIFEGRNSETYIFSGTEAETEIKLKPIRKNLFNTDEEITNLQRFYWPQGLPVYNDQLLEFQKNLQLPKYLYLHGNYVAGIGLSKIVSHAYHLTEKIVKDLQ